MVCKSRIVEIYLTKHMLLAVAVLLTRVECSEQMSVCWINQFLLCAARCNLTSITVIRVVVAVALVAGMLKRIIDNVNFDNA